MHITFEDISDDAKIWIYQSDKILNNQIRTQLDSILLSFCSQWSSHGVSLKSSYYIDSWFVCFLVDETQKDASGCSIDGSVKIIKQIEDQFNLNLFSRTNILIEEEQKTKLITLNELKKIANPKMLVYNTLVNNKYEFVNHFKIPITKSWLSKYVSK